MEYFKYKSALLIALQAVFFVAPVLADQPLIVVVSSLNSKEENLFVRQISAELCSMGFVPRLVEQSANNWNPEDLEKTARHYGAVAAITLRHDPERPVVWIADRITGKLLRRAVQSETDPPNVLAIRAVELLRASLLELEADHSIRSQVMVTAEIKQLAKESLRPKFQARSSGLMVAMEAGAASSPGGMSSSALGLIELSFVPHQWIGVSGIIVFPITSAEKSAAEGKSEIWFGMAGLAIRLEALSSDNAWSIDADLGIGGQLAIITGEPRVDLREQTEIERTFAPFVRVGISRSIYQWLNLRADFLAVFSVPSLEINFVGRDVATFGFPWFGFAFGVELGMS